MFEDNLKAYLADGELLKGILYSNNSAKDAKRLVAELKTNPVRENLSKISRMFRSDYHQAHTHKSKISFLIIELQNAGLLRQVLQIQEWPTVNNNLQSLLYSYPDIRVNNCIIEELGDDFTTEDAKRFIDNINSAMKTSKFAFKSETVPFEERKRLKNIACYLNVIAGRNFPISGDHEMQRKAAILTDRLSQFRKDIIDQIEESLLALVNSEDEVKVAKFKSILTEKCHMSSEIVERMNKEQLAQQAQNIAKNEANKVVADVLHNFDKIQEMQRLHQALIVTKKEKEYYQLTEGEAKLPLEIRQNIVEEYSYHSDLSEQVENIDRIIATQMYNHGITRNKDLDDLIVRKAASKVPSATTQVVRAASSKSGPASAYPGS